MDDQCLCGINPGGVCDRSCEQVQQTTLDDLHRVYGWEWVLVYTSAKTAFAGLTEVKEFFAGKYAGRVRDEHVECRSAGKDQPTQLWLCLPTLKGEFKHEERARALAAATASGGGVTVVVRNSRDERELLEYGKRKLPSDQV